jgi:hypothetical protein
MLPGFRGFSMLFLVLFGVTEASGITQIKTLSSFQNITKVMKCRPLYVAAVVTVVREIWLVKSVKYG